MRTKRIFWLTSAAAVLGIGGAWIAVQLQEPLAKWTQVQQEHAPGAPPNFPYPGARGERDLDVPYVPTPEVVVMAMLKLADVKEGEMVYDLGCGDGRIVITAAQKFGARGVGVDIDPERIKESNVGARKAGVADRVRFYQKDLFKVDLRDADVVTLYLLPEVNLKLRPKLLRELRPGVRVVSHDFDMGDWQPDKTIEVLSERSRHALYFWRIPADIAGTWRWTASTSKGTERYVAQLRQQFQKVSGTLKMGDRTVPIAEARLEGDRLSLTIDEEQERSVIRLKGRVSGDRVEGTAEIQGGPSAGTRDWVATREGATRSS